MTPEASVLARHRMERAAASCAEGDLPASDFVEISAEEAEKVRGEVHAFVNTCREILERPQE